MSIMKLYFLVVCHKITPSLLYNLEKFSKFKKSKVLVHIDKKSNFSKKNLFESDNISYMKDRLNIKWGNVSQIQLTYEMFKLIKNEDFDYASLMSGEDLFIHSEIQFISFLKKHRTQEFLGVERCDGKFYNPEERFIFNYPSSYFCSNPSIFNKVVVRIYNKLFKFGFLKNKKPFPYENFYKGSNWFTISKDMVNLFEKKISDKKLLEFFKHSFCIDEVVLQTIVMNNNLKDKLYLINDNVDDNKMSLRYVNWKDGPEHPKVLEKNDLIQIKDDIFFVRKISPKLSLEDLRILLG